MFSKKNKQFLKLCISTAEIFSTCGKKKYAAILVDKYGHVVGMGYNGGPRGSVHCDSGGCPRLFEKSPSGSVYDNCISIHAEQNAFIHSDYSLEPFSLYVNGPPCFTCAKIIVNSTVKNLFCTIDNSYEDWKNVKSFLQDNGIMIEEIDKWQLEN